MPQRLNSLIRNNQELGKLSGKARQLLVLQRQYEQVCPASLQRASHVMQLEDNVLTLAANNGAIAAKLRQMTPELIRQLQLQGCEVTGIQVRVQVNPPMPALVQPARALSIQGKEQLLKLSSKLGDSPLKSALDRLIAARPPKRFK